MARRKTRRARWGAETHTDVQQSSVRPEAQDPPARTVPGPADSLYARLAQVPAWEEPAPAPEPRIVQRTPGLERLARCGWTVHKTQNAPSGKTRREHQGYVYHGGSGSAGYRVTLRPNLSHKRGKPLSAI